VAGQLQRPDWSLPLKLLPTAVNTYASTTPFGQVDVVLCYWPDSESLLSVVPLFLLVVDCLPSFNQTLSLVD